MNTKSSNEASWKGLLPRGNTAIAGAVILVFVAFLLGYLFSPSGDIPESASPQAQSHTAAAPTIWTCSMHPQIRMPKPGKCPICFMDLIPVETGSGDELGPRQLRMSETAMQLVQIQTAPVRRAYQDASIRLTGKIAYDETRVAHITARFPGRLDKLYADYTGMKIGKQEKLADIYSPQLVAAQEELIQAVRFNRQASAKSGSTLANTAQTTLEAARTKLKQWGLSNDQIAAIESQTEPTEEMALYSPLGGVITEKNVVEGSYITTGAPLFIVADLSRLWLTLDAYGSDLPYLRKGQQISFTAVSFPGKTFTATIDFIDPTVNDAKRTVMVRAIVDNGDGLLKPDMFVQAIVRSRLDRKGKIMAGEKSAHNQSLDDAPLLIPASAPLITGKRAVVYVQVPDTTGEPIFEGREVELGPRAGDYYIVASGLIEGEMVVVNGAFKLDSELQIQAKPSMMSPKGGTPPPVHHHGDEPMAMNGTKATNKTKPTGEQIETIAALTPVYEAYFAVQMALAQDSLEAAIGAFGRLGANIRAIDMRLFSMAGHEKWMAISIEMAKYAQQGATAKNLEAARDAFYFLSNATLKLHDAFGHTADEKYFLTFCPMARDNKGAFWLQKANIVWNSFYGDRMLRCGEIKDSTGPMAGEVR